MMSKTRLLIAFIWMDKIKILAVYFSLPDPRQTLCQFCPSHSMEPHFGIMKKLDNNMQEKGMEMPCPIVTASKDPHQPEELKQDFSLIAERTQRGGHRPGGINSLGDKGYLRTERSHRSSLSILPGACKRSLRKKMIKVVLSSSSPYFCLIPLPRDKEATERFRQPNDSSISADISRSQVTMENAALTDVPSLLSRVV